MPKEAREELRLDTDRLLLRADLARPAAITMSRASDKRSSSIRRLSVPSGASCDIPPFLMTHKATVAVAEVQGVAVASLGGDIDLEGNAAISREIAGVADRAAGLVLDLAAVTFLDSSGLRLVFSLRRRLARRRQRLAVVLPLDERVRQVFVLIDAEDVLELFESVYG